MVPIFKGILEIVHLLVQGSDTSFDDFLSSLLSFSYAPQPVPVIVFAVITIACSIRLTRDLQLYHLKPQL